ncbi:undecaprenyldiphospho-muramoylpentapeptide beta-N-acetylglucosaminyltransferase [Capilliphycus salinus ALCB114379]|uniref:undecaprenyldiphospho-muramoylpentapeptide beta-N-acetylglucosaminyltransferase n=1 Tax=Capilliphycus salinus TaxID=2768948 RepID=UPI0039A60704
MRLLIAASGTGGHLFPAIATATQLSNYEIEWLGVPDRLETQLVPQQYPLHTIGVQGFQERFGLGTLRTFTRLTGSILQVRRLLKQGNFQGVFSTGGYIAAPAILAARSLGLPVILHESNALPGKVTRLLSGWCDLVALGFDCSTQYLPKAKKTAIVGTPVRSGFLGETEPLPFSIPENAPLIVVVGGSQGAVAVNQLVRSSASAWFDTGAWVVHLTGTNDPHTDSLQHPQYLAMPFYDNMPALLKRANLAISRAGAGTLTELAVTRTPSILIPYPYAAEDHQTYNAKVFADAGAGLLLRQTDLTGEILKSKVSHLLKSPQQLQDMAIATANLAVLNSAEQLASAIAQVLNTEGKKNR